MAVARRNLLPLECLETSAFAFIHNPTFALPIREIPTFSEGRGFFPGRSRRNRLRRTHLNGNRGFRNAFLMRLRRGRLCQGRRTLAQGTDSRVCGPWDELRRPHCAPGLLAPRCAARTASRCVAGGADHPSILRAVPSFHGARQRNCHASCGPPPSGCLLVLCSASVGTPGRLRVGQLG